MPPVTGRRTDEIWLRRELSRLVRESQALSEGVLTEVLEQVDATTTDAVVIDRDPVKSAPKIGRPRRVRVDSSQRRALALVLQEMRRRITQLDREAERIAQEFVDRVEASHRKRYFKRLRSAVGVDLEQIVSGEGLGSAVAQSVETNVALIKSIPQQQLGRVQALVEGAVLRGEAPDGGMAAELRRIGGITLRRARFIARDQTAKLNGALNQARNLAVGIVEYEWRDSGDGRVRPNHAEKHGKIYRWDSPPPDTGHPGEDYGCRCVARSVIPD
jgi:SPP1 gp7 family putative phage head morphogenesis protein